MSVLRDTPSGTQTDKPDNSGRRRCRWPQASAAMASFDLLNLAPALMMASSEWHPVRHPRSQLWPDERGIGSTRFLFSMLDRVHPIILSEPLPPDPRLRVINRSRRKQSYENRPTEAPDTGTPTHGCSNLWHCAQSNTWVQKSVSLSRTFAPLCLVEVTAYPQLNVRGETYTWLNRFASHLGGGFSLAFAFVCTCFILISI